MTESFFVKKLESSYATDGFFTRREIGVGYGIADLVLFTPHKERITKRAGYGQHTRLFGESYFQVLSLIADSETNKNPTHISEIEEQFSMSSQTLRYKVIPKLKRAGYIKEVGDNLYLKINGWLPIGKELIAIEAKLHNWNRGLKQAIRYKTFAHRTYLAVPPSTAKNVPRESMERYGVGLVSFDPETGIRKILVKAPSRAPRNPHKRDYASEYFWDAEVKKGVLS